LLETRAISKRAAHSESEWRDFCESLIPSGFARAPRTRATHRALSPNMRAPHQLNPRRAPARATGHPKSKSPPRSKA